MVYVKNVIREMFQKTYVIRDLKENGLGIRDRDPHFTTLYIIYNISLTKHKHQKPIRIRSKCVYRLEHRKTLASLSCFYL